MYHVQPQAHDVLTHDEYDRRSVDIKGNSIAVLVKDLAEELHNA
jgi:hypothetical protein